MNGPDSHDGTAQKLKYKIILTQDIAYVKRIRTIYSICRRGGRI